MAIGAECSGERLPWKKPTQSVLGAESAGEVLGQPDTSRDNEQKASQEGKKQTRGLHFLH